VSGWEIAGFVSWFAAVLGGLVFVARELWIDGRRSHEAANGRIGDTHQPVIVPAQVWQQSCGAGTTEFPAPPVAYPSLLTRLVGSLVDGWAVLSTGLASGDRPAAPAGRHRPPDARTPQVVAEQLAAGAVPSDEQARQVVDHEFNSAVAAGGRASMPERLPWDVVDRVRGSAPVVRPFDEQVRVRDDVLHGRVRAAANDEPTTLLPRVPPGGVR